MKNTPKNHIRLLNCPVLIELFFFVMVPSHTQFPVTSTPLLVFFEKSCYISQYNIMLLLWDVSFFICCIITNPSLWSFVVCTSRGRISVLRWVSSTSAHTHAFSDRYTHALSHTKNHALISWLAPKDNMFVGFGFIIFIFWYW